MGFRKRSGAAGFTARVAPTRAAVDARHLRSPTIAMQVSPIGCRAGRSPRRPGAAPTRGRAALQQPVDVPELHSLEGCPTVALAHVPSSGDTGRTFSHARLPSQELRWL